MTRTHAAASAPVLILVGVVFVVWTVRATVLYSLDEAISGDLLRSLWSNFVKFVVWVLPAVAFARYVRRRSAWEYLGLAARPNAGQWCLTLLTTVAYLAIVGTIDVTLGGKSFTLFDASVATVLSVALSHLVSPVLEEILFRGLVLHELMGSCSFWRANLFASLLFVAFHWPYRLWTGGLTPELLITSVGLLAISLLLGWLYAVSDSLWPPITAHFAYNVVVSFLVLPAK